MERFDGKVALITGGGGDIGKAVATRLLEEGAKICLTDYKQEPLDEAIAQLNVGPDRVCSVVGDVRDMDDCAAVAKHAVDTFGHVDVLVTTAGILNHAPIDEMEEKAWQDVLDINLTGTFHSIKSVVPYMKSQKYGRIVTVSSLGGRTGRPGVGVNYAASKAGVVGLTMLLGYELGAWNITVNSIAPGPLKGRMHYSQSPEVAARLRSGIPLVRLGELSEAAAAIAFLASDDAAWATGEILDYNGGLQY